MTLGMELLKVLPNVSRVILDLLARGVLRVHRTGTAAATIQQMPAGNALEALLRSHQARDASSAMLAKLVLVKMALALSAWRALATPRSSGQPPRAKRCSAPRTRDCA